MTILPDGNIPRAAARNVPDRRVLATDRDRDRYAWAAVKLPADDPDPSAPHPRYLQHGRVLPSEDGPSVSPARVRQVISDLLSAYSPSLLVLTARPPLRAASTADPYAFLAEAQARRIPVAVVDPARLLALLPPAPGT